MPQPVLTKYKQGDLGAEYPKDKPVGKELDMSIQACLLYTSPSPRD